MKVYGIKLNDELLMYHSDPAVIICEVFAISGINNVDIGKAFKDIDMLKKHCSIYERDELRNQGLLKDYYGKNRTFHSWHGILQNIQVGLSRKFRLNPEIELCCTEMTQCEICKIPEI